MPNWRYLIRDAGRSAKEIVGKVWPYVILGIAIGAGIHGFVPESYLADIRGRSSWWAALAAVLLGIPLYSNAAGINTYLITAHKG